MFRSLITLIVIFCLFSSCKSILGLHDAKSLTTKETIKYAASRHLKQVYKIDGPAFVNKYETLLNDNDSLKGIAQDLYQPLQLIVFDKNAENVCHLINCNIGGIPLKWNRYKSFESVPVRPNDFREPLYKVTLEDVCSIITPTLSADSLKQVVKRDYDFIYFVQDATFMGYFKKSFERTISKYQKRFPESEILYIHILSDDLHAYFETHQKAQVRLR